MKMSFCQMIATVCVLVIGFMIVSPLVPSTEANPHKYHYEVYYIADICENGHTHGIWFVQRILFKVESHYNGHANHYDGDGPSWTQDHNYIEINDISCSNNFYV